MKIPKKIRIMGLNWTIEESEKVTNETNSFGSTHFRKQRIFICPEENQDKKEQTFFHEILHVIWWSMGMDERMKKVEGIKEEEIIITMANGLYHFLKDNKFIK